MISTSKQLLPKIRHKLKYTILILNCFNNSVTDRPKEVKKKKMLNFIRQLQIKTIVRYHLTTDRFVVNNKTKGKWYQVYGEEGTLALC